MTNLIRLAVLFVCPSEITAADRHFDDKFNYRTISLTSSLTKPKS
ncbi:hypothetical protein SH139x_005095 [Planctomycetaceae bacterium SH139]